MNSSVVRIVLAAPFVAMFVAAFAIAMAIEWCTDLTRGRQQETPS
jgi:hypothetical protein